MNYYNFVEFTESLTWEECNDLSDALYRQRKRLIAQRVDLYPRPADDVINDASHIMAIKRYRDANPSLSLMEAKIVMDVYRKKAVE